MVTFKGPHALNPKQIFRNYSLNTFTAFPFTNILKNSTKSNISALLHTFFNCFLSKFFFKLIAFEWIYFHHIKCTVIVKYSKECNLFSMLILLLTARCHAQWSSINKSEMQVISWKQSNVHDNDLNLNIFRCHHFVRLNCIIIIFSIIIIPSFAAESSRNMFNNSIFNSKKLLVFLHSRLMQENIVNWWKK